jgi:hypothetical protein
MVSLTVLIGGGSGGGGGLCVCVCVWEGGRKESVEGSKWKVLHIFSKAVGISSNRISD